MDYSINYYADFRHITEVDEIILNYELGSDYLLTFIPKITRKNKNKKIVVDTTYILDDKLDAAIIYINNLRKDGYDITARFNFNDSYQIEKFKDAGIPFFFGDHFCINLEMADYQIKMGASQIYVAEELGFHLKDIQYLRTEYGIKIRVFPNICQSQNNRICNSMESFWIRPEDTELYEPYVDTFEIMDWSDESRSGSRLSVLYEIYKQRQWLGNLNDIILDFDSSTIVDNKGINPHFGEIRVNCGKKCLLGKCHLCEQTKELASTFIDAGITLTRPKYKEEITEEQIEKAREILNEYKND